MGGPAEPSPEGNPPLAAAVGAILDRRLAASHGSGDDTGRRAALLLEILPDAAAALEAAAPLIAAAERERIAKLAEAVGATRRQRCTDPAHAAMVHAIRAGGGHDTPFADLLRDEIASRAEELHAEHHAGYIVPSLDSCPEHNRAAYEQIVRDLLRDQP